MNESIPEHLLRQVSAISTKFNEIAKITGERFNIFRVLGVSTKEVKTHSAFIAELLNNKGSHGCGDKFLVCFIEQQKTKFRDTELIKKLDEFRPENRRGIL